MSDIEVTIRLSAEEVRYLREQWTRIPVPGVHMADKFTDKLLAALPKPRIHPQPGDVLRRKSDGAEWFAGQAWQSRSLDVRRVWMFPAIWTRTDQDGAYPDDGLDRADWEIVTAAELAELFDRKRAQS